MDLNDRIKEIVEIQKADFYGVADLSPAYEAILAQGGAEVAKYPRAISIGIVLLHEIVDQLPNRASRAVAMSYRQQCYYYAINQRLDFIASCISSSIQQEGYKAMPVPATKHIDNERLCAVFSHKLAAHLAGLGWIGKNCLLVTPGQGPRARWVTVLTNAELPVTGKAMEERCGSCNECVKICPVLAFTGKNFMESEPREKRYDAGKCARYFAMMRNKDTDTAVCGLCLYACPYGRNRSSEKADL